MAPTEFPEIAGELMREDVFVPTGELARLAKKELNEDEQTRESGLREMRSWLASNPHLRNCRTDRVFLLRFLRSQKFDLCKTKKVLQRYLKMRMESPDWFMSLDPTTDTCRELVCNGFIFVLPERDSAGRAVIVNMGGRMDLEKHTNVDLMKAMVGTIETLLEDEENQIRGFTSIVYTREMSVAHLGVWTPTDAARLFGTCEKNFAVRHKSINVVGLPFAFWAVVEFVKRFLSPKIKERLDTGCDEAKLAKKLGGGDNNVSSSSLLPSDMGGGGLSAREMGAKWLRKLHANKANLINLDLMLVDPAKVEENCQALKKSTGGGTSKGLWSYLPGL